MNWLENDRRPDNAAGSKWIETLEQLLQLARTAGSEFDFEKALQHLVSMEELWASKGLPTFSLDLRYDLLNEKGKVLTKLGRYKEAVDEYQNLLEYCQDQNLVERKVEVFLEVGQLLAKIGEHDRALGYVHRALSGYRRLKDPHGICKSLRNLGVIYIELGEFEDAENAYEEAIEISRDNELTLLNADLYNNFGTIKNIKGDWKAALECYTIARDIYDQEGEVRKCAYTLNNIGITLLEQERNQSALSFFIRALEVVKNIKDESLNLILNINLTDISLKIGMIEDAEKYCRAAVDYLEQNNLKNGQLVETLKLAGKIELNKNNYQQAEIYLNRALGLCGELGLQYQEAEVMFEQGDLYLKSERHMEALQALDRAIRIFLQLKAAGRVEKTESLISLVEDLYLEIFESMAEKVDQKDPYTKGHSDRVASLSMYIAQSLGLSDNEIKAIVAGALLHDIGKLNMPDEILKKPGRLTPEEYAEVKNHPDNGVQILSGIRFPWDIIPLIRHHHEQFNGKGYPSGIEGELIPVGARIICVADVFDALTSERPYRDAFSAEKALAVMTDDMSGAFDPIIFERFIELINQGTVDHIINRKTDRDELYKIWSQLRAAEIDLYQ